MALYDLVRDLPLRVDAYELDPHELYVRPEFTRQTTVVRLLGDGEEGLGEDVTYDGPLQEAQQQRGPVLPLAGEWTIDSFSRRLETVALFPEPPERHEYLDYRRWAFESAALDLALVQAGRSLGDVIGREARPVRFVSSTRADSLDGWLALYPALRFKLDPTPDWTEEKIAALAAGGKVDTADLKGAYHGTVVDNPPNPELYARVAEGLPGAWI